MCGWLECPGRERGSGNEEGRRDDAALGGACPERGLCGAGPTGGRKRRRVESRRDCRRKAKGGGGRRKSSRGSRRFGGYQGKAGAAPVEVEGVEGQGEGKKREKEEEKLSEGSGQMPEVAQWMSRADTKALSRCVTTNSVVSWVRRSSLQPLSRA